MTLILQFDSLVIDSGAIIKGHGYSFHQKAKVFYTTEGVINEIRDSKSRELLANLPFELIVRNPSHNALKAVVDFSKKSGDYASLSKTDICVLALTYMLEVEAKGTSDNIRKEPVQQTKRTNRIEGLRKSENSKISNDDDKLWDNNNINISCDCAHSTRHTTPEESLENSQYLEDQIQLLSTTTTTTDYPPSVSVGETAAEDITNNVDEITTRMAAVDLLPEPPIITSNITTTTKSSFSWAQIVSSPIPITPPPVPPVRKEISASLPTLSSDDTPNLVDDVMMMTTTTTTPLVLPPTITSSNNTSHKNISHSRILTGGVALGSSSSSSSSSRKIALEDDGLNWVTPQNINTCRASGKGMFGTESQFVESPQSMDSAKVACMTTDYSMQNVLLQMGLAVCSVDGMRVRQLRSWVKQCSACFTMHHDMDKLFCTRCGGTTLQRIATSVDANTGEVKFHLRKNYQYNARGTKYSLPKPGQQGKFDGELLLREDQLLSGIWRQKVAKGKKELTSAFGEDIAVDVGIHINKSAVIKIGLGRRNPNADKGRKSRGKK